MARRISTSSTKRPTSWAIFTIMLDRPRPPKSRRDRLRLALEKINLTRFRDLLQESRWDVVVNTHFLPAEIIASLRREEKLSLPQITATTDFETHRLWVNEPCDLYTTATAEGAAYLRHWGVAADHVQVTGIPIHPVFAEAKDRSAPVFNPRDLVGDRPILLQLAGGFGVGPIEQALPRSAGSSGAAGDRRCRRTQ